ncbi:MAG: sulfotransferase [Aquisalimonadaceae bacterium]
MSYKPPVIIIGMHRSGTSMLTRVLQGFGFYMGRGTTRNEECRFTNALNYWIFRQSSATWERPEGVDALLADPRIRGYVEDYLAGVVDGPASWRYLGLRRWLRYRSMQNIREPWGWKDPRNSYTLPVWLNIFPDARVLHIMRHGVDVAESLRVRRSAAVEASAARFMKARRRYLNNPLAPKRGGFAHSMRCATLAGGLDLWEAYTARARHHVEALGERALELRYEDLLADPVPHLRRIIDFCGLNADDSAIHAIAAKFDGSRAYAYRGDPELVEFAGQSTARLARLGYREQACDGASAYSSE